MSVRKIVLPGTRPSRLARLLLLSLTVGGMALPVIADENTFEYLDHETAASITGATQPLVFARQRTDLAAHERDYITLTAIEINRSGKRKYFWWGYVWSTIDRRGGERLLGSDDTLVLIADGRPIRLACGNCAPRDEGIAQAPTAPPLRTAIPVLFNADLEVMRYVAQATDLQIELVRAGISEPFQLWKDGRAALTVLVTELQ